MQPAEIVAEIRQLPEADREIVVQSLGLPTPEGEALNRVWYMIVGTVALVTLLGFVGLFWLVNETKETDVIVPIVTTALGGIIGLMSPSPVGRG